MQDENPIPMRLQIQSTPLALLLDIPESGQRFVVPLSVTAAQSLALALLAQTPAGGKLEPLLADAIHQARAERDHEDRVFLKAAGVAHE